MLTDDSHLIYKVCPAAERHGAVAAGTYRGSAVDLRDGFIHFSAGGAQIAKTLRRHLFGAMSISQSCPPHPVQPAPSPPRGRMLHAAPTSRSTS